MVRSALSSRGSYHRRARGDRGENFEGAPSRSARGVPGVLGVQSFGRQRKSEQPLLREAVLGEGLGRGARPTIDQRQRLFRLLLLVHTRRRRSVAGELLQIILQQADFYAAAAGV